MKKNDGYVIIYVVFVIIFLCIVAVGTCTSALNNLKTQHAVVEQMQDRYTAEGNIEQFMAEVCVAGEAISSNSHYYSTIQDAVDNAKGDFVRLINQKLVPSPEKAVSGTCIKWENNTEYTVTLETTCGNTKVTAEVAFRVSIDTNTHKVKVEENGEQDEKTYYGYNITDVTSKYLSYTLESTGGKAK